MRRPVLLGLLLPLAVLQFAVIDLAAPDRAAAAPAARDAKPGTKAGAKPAPADPRVWAIVKADDTYVMRYGASRVADPLFAVACQPAAALLQFTVDVPAGRVKAGDGVAVSLAAGKRRMQLAATAFRGTGDRLVVEAAVTLEDAVLDLFASGEQLTVSMDGTRETIPLAGAKAKLSDFRRVCLGGS
ncbi:hypothetical protein [Xanthobacter sp. KR7-225]|uniref:hypothetical protein n=1 Tax=Xanthobacter sp. KR7-225 TaxID=3156613 RepID=UPI0032B52F00